MAFFLYIVQELLVGLSEATELETNREVKDKIKTAQVVTVISWCTYPVVYLFPMLGISASKAVVGIQVGYCASDIIEVRCWLVHLPDLLRQVQAGGLNKELGFFEVEVGGQASARGSPVGTPRHFL